MSPSHEKVPEVIIEKIILDAMKLRWQPVCDEIKLRSYVINLSKRYWTADYMEFINYAEQVFPECPRRGDFNTLQDFNLARFMWINEKFKHYDKARARSASFL